MKYKLLANMLKIAALQPEDLVNMGNYQASQILAMLSKVNGPFELYNPNQTKAMHKKLKKVRDLEKLLDMADENKKMIENRLNSELEKYKQQYYDLRFSNSDEKYKLYQEIGSLKRKLSEAEFSLKDSKDAYNLIKKNLAKKVGLTGALGILGALLAYRRGKRKGMSLARLKGAFR